ncbi:MAG TPA: carboxylesterase family protein [Candidatus Binatia bacterium]|jgi:para-nitrobenzyl esterase|nr:carboxylesterase family protein [Candidatus Binatia bacterium]
MVGSYTLIRYALAFGLTALAPAQAMTSLPSPTVQTADGPVTGAVTDTISSFLGLPYAAPPVGELRWRPPQARSPWSTPLDATTFGTTCPQGTSTNEDCLSLNVYVPTKALHARGRRRYPVMVWMHGGAYFLGAGSQFDPTEMVTTGHVIVVTINYRIGALGFMAHPALSAETSYGGSGNYGIMDQQLALQWVQRNIAAFGGNPKRVTIFGESAGGNSMFAHLVSPTAKGLFQRVISQSGTSEQRLPALAEAEATGQTFATAVGCPDQTAECLRAVPVATLVAQQGLIGSPALIGIAATPNIDGGVLPKSIDAALTSGEFHRVPVVNGTNRDEMRLYIALYVTQAIGPITPELLPGLTSVFVGSNTPAVLAEYPARDYPSPDLNYTALLTDYIFACPAFEADQAMAKFAKIYAYEFADENAPTLGFPPVSFPYGASHGFELPYLFDYAGYAPRFTAEQQKLSEWMIRAWTNFAKHGKPGGGWTPLKRAGDGFFASLVPPQPVRKATSDFDADHKCQFWRSLGE